jgi:hypothetical protein
MKHLVHLAQFNLKKALKSIKKAVITINFEAQATLF